MDCDRSDPETVSSPVHSKGPEEARQHPGVQVQASGRMGRGRWELQGSREREQRKIQQRRTSTTDILKRLEKNTV